MKNKKCLVCSKEFTKPINCSLKDWNGGIGTRRPKGRLFCSLKCRRESRKGKPTWNKGLKTGIVPKTAIKKGQRLSPKTEFKKGHTSWNEGLIGFNEGEKNSNWRGNDVGNSGIHIWLRKTFGKPERCEFCGVKGKYVGKIRKKWSIEYASNNGHNYVRDRSKFFTLCVKCHKQYDK